jgi:hypothetical protein
MDAFAEKFEDEFSLVVFLSSNSVAELEDSGSSRHITGIRSVFLSVSETGSDSHVGSGVGTMHAVKGIGRVRFQLESSGSLEVVEVMYVPELKVNFLSLATLEDMGYAVMFEDGQVFIRAEGADTQDVAVRLGIREGMMYRVPGQPVLGSKGILDQRSVSVAESCGRVASSKTTKFVTWYDLTLMEKPSRTSD